MWLQIRSFDDSTTFTIDNLSRLSKVCFLKQQIASRINVPLENLNLFFGDKKLLDGTLLFHYGIKIDSVVQYVSIMKNEDTPTEQCIKFDNHLKVIEEEELSITEETLFYKDQIVDVKMLEGNYYSAKILRVFNEAVEVIYDVKFFGRKSETVRTVMESDIMPRALNKVKYEDVEIGHSYLVNYNAVFPKERGFWYKCFVKSKGRNEMTVELVCKSIDDPVDIKFIDDIYAIEDVHSIDYKEFLLPNEDDNERYWTLLSRLNEPECRDCWDNPSKKCTSCNCYICGIKQDSNKQLYCEKCLQYYHCYCLKPPVKMSDLDDDEDWYCPDCLNTDINDKSFVNPKKRKTTPNLTRVLRRGMACTGYSDKSRLISKDRFGAIPGVEVGQSWVYRLQAAEAAVHRSPVAGICGKAKLGCTSVVLAGGYEDDVDMGDEFFYTGSGGRDLSSHRRTNKQSFDQELTRFNLSIALNCDASLNSVHGNEAKNWRRGKPIRVIRSYKAARHSKYAPELGIRYDGLYKVVKYWPEAGISGFRVWRYHFRRDDPIPAPWTEEGKERIEKLCITIKLPNGFPIEKLQNYRYSKKNIGDSSRKRKHETIIS